MNADVFQQLSSSNVPQQNLLKNHQTHYNQSTRSAYEVVESSTEKNILGSWVPLDNTNTALMSLQSDDSLVQILSQTSIGDLPHTDAESALEIAYISEQ